MRTDHDLAFDPTFEPDPRPRRVLLLVLLALAVGALALGAVVGLRGGAGQPVAVAAPSGAEPAGGGDTGTGTGQAPQENGQPQDQNGDGEGGQGDGGQEPEAKPAELMVGPDPVTLPVGVYSGSFTVANAGDEAMQWTAASKPSVTLSDSGGELSGGGENVVSFTVDEDTLEAGAFSFKVKVMGAGETVYVDVKGAKPIDVLKS